MHKSARFVLRLLREPRKWAVKRTQPIKVYWNDKLVPKWHERTFGGWLYVDETGSPPSSSSRFYVGATGVFVPKIAQSNFEDCCLQFRNALGVYGANSAMEIHAVDWVHHGHGFPTGTHVGVRVHWLRRFMANCSTVPNIAIINVLADSSTPRVVVGKSNRDKNQLQRQMRLDVFAKLLSEFDAVLLNRGMKGHALVDENQIGSVRALHRSLCHSLPKQPLAPIAVKSDEYHGVQLADVCAYFMLQQVQPNNVIVSLNAEHGLNDISQRCPDPRNPNIAQIHYV
ncbi:MAG: DUF3800 domain-containing protein [Armatimonadetes bacterium]|nr:DUF3800 domain-containing protein [Armatimonadota bacterium]